MPVPYCTPCKSFFTELNKHCQEACTSCGSVMLVERTRCRGCTVEPATMDDYCGPCTAKAIAEECTGHLSVDLVIEEYPAEWRADLRRELAQIRKEVRS